MYIESLFNLCCKRIVYLTSKDMEKIEIRLNYDIVYIKDPNKLGT